MTVQLDTTSSYNSSTGIFTAPVTGLYNISASFYNSTGTNYAVVDIKKNDSIMFRQAVGYVIPDATISGAVYLNAGDTTGIHSTYANSQSIQVDAGHAMSIFLVH